MGAVFANYDLHRSAFSSLTEQDCKKRILLFPGESGTGKTTLIQACQNNVCEPVYHVPVQLRKTSVNVPELFTRAGRKIGWKNLKNFSEKISDLSGMDLNVNIQKNHQTGIGNIIRVALKAENTSDRSERQAIVTDAWFEDIFELDQLLLITLDTYEQASVEMQEWISGPFLSRVVDCPNIRVVVAGQEIPDANNIEWHDCCDVYELSGVLDAQHWLPVVNAIKCRIPDKPVLTWMAAICYVYNGRPDSIMKILQGLPPLNEK